ncbi:MAG: NERD domain-containing protein [Clostridiales bacterium]|jgi:hypothetical protein|nr:NERD domain-containing protein [Clostridiales bacterium]
MPPIPKLNRPLFFVLLACLIVPGCIYAYIIQKKQETWYKECAQLKLKQQLSERDKQLLLSVTNLDRGTELERQCILKLLKSNIVSAGDVYHDMYFKRWDDNFVRVPLIVVAKSGLIVLCVQECQGEIYGKIDQKIWDNVSYSTTKKIKIFNPIVHNIELVDIVKDNIATIDLPKSLKYQDIRIYSMTVFGGDCQFKDILLTQPVSSKTKNNKPHKTSDKDQFVIRDWQILDVVRDIVYSQEPLQQYDSILYQALVTARQYALNDDIVLNYYKQDHDLRNKYLV